MRIPEGPIWPQTAQGQKSYPPLKDDVQTDILVIGGGITGVQTAYLLANEEKKVILIEKEAIGEGATEYTTAFITSVVDTGLVDLKSMYGARSAYLIWESTEKAIDFIEKTISDENISCEFMRCNSFQYTNNTEDAEKLRAEANLIKSLGINMPYREKNQLGFRNFGYQEAPRQAKFHPLSYLYQLARITEKMGVEIFEKTEALDIEEEKDHIRVKTNKGIISAQYVIQATYAPIKEPLTFKFKKGMYTTYVLYTEIPKNMLPEALYEDAENPYHYFRVDKGDSVDYLLIGGEDHREEVPIDPEKNFVALEKYLQEILPFKYKIIRRWTGAILEPSDGLPFIGRIEKDKNVLIATAFSGTGMTYSVIAAQILKDIILGKKNKYEKLYSAARTPSLKQLMKKGADYTQEFFGGAVKNTFSRE